MIWLRNTLNTLPLYLWQCGPAHEGPPLNLVGTLGCSCVCDLHNRSCAVSLGGGVCVCSAVCVSEGWRGTLASLLSVWGHCWPPSQTRPHHLARARSHTWGLLKIWMFMYACTCKSVLGVRESQESLFVHVYLHLPLETHQTRGTRNK